MYTEYQMVLADGTSLALRAADDGAGRIVDFFASVARLSPAPGPLPAGCTRILAVTGAPRKEGPYRVRYECPEDVGRPGDAICTFERPDARRLLRARRRARAREGKPSFETERLTGEQWQWRQLVRLSACIARQVARRGGVLLHGGLAESPPSAPLAGSGQAPGGLGFLLAGRSGVGKSTASRRLSPPWRSLSDDVTLVVRDDDGQYWAHPWPTWSRFFGPEAGDGSDTWDTQRAVPLGAIAVLERGPADRVEPLGAGQAVALLTELARQTTHHMERDMGLDVLPEWHGQRFENVCTLVRDIPAYTLYLTRRGAFWLELERALTSA